MPVAAVFTFASAELYDKHLEQFGDVLRAQPARRSHVCFEWHRGFMVVDVWDSIEDFERFGETIAGITTAVGVEGATPSAIDVTLHAVHNFISG